MFLFNGTKPKKITFNGKNVKKLIYNGVEVWLDRLTTLISGALPLTLLDCTGENAVDYTISGNATQSIGEYDATSGKYKMPVVARGKNLINYRNFVSRNQSTMPLTINDDGSLDYTGTYYIKVDLSHLQSGKIYAFRMTYTFDGEVVNLGDNLGTGQFRYTDGTYIGARYGQGIQTDPNKELLEFHCYFKSGYQQTFTAKIWDIQLEESTASTDYEPYKEPITTDIYLDEPLSSGDSINYKEDNLPPLPTLEGTTVYDVRVEAQPSVMEVSYYQKS